MSADKRTVATDALETLGKIISPNEKRDAIHLAVEPATAKYKLQPNTDVGVEITDGKMYGVAWSPGVELVGKVDPFLERAVEPGEMFWLVVYPRQITSLRHVWAHPSFPTAEEAEADEIVFVLSGNKESEEWIENFVTGLGIGYHEMIEAARDYVQCGDYLVKGELLEGEYVPEEFWDHYCAVTGETVKEDDRNSFFSCSC